MYDRAPRPTANYPDGSTTDNVGPGSYDPRVPSAKWMKSDGYAPFLSMSGSYNLSKKQDWIKPAPAQMPTFNEEPQKQHKVIITSKVRYLRQPDAPSIPSPGQAYGYEETDDGTLQKQAPPQRDATLGPAFYKPTIKDTAPTQKYKGIHFGALRSSRIKFSGKNGPGPGEYNPYKDTAENDKSIIQLVNPDGKKFESRLPRYHEIVVAEEEKKAVPGPGKYEVPGPSHYQPKNKPEERYKKQLTSAFSSLTDRLHSPVAQTLKENPPPGSYEVANSFSRTQEKRISMNPRTKEALLRNRAFMTSSDRFAPPRDIVVERPEADIPGPGTYNGSEMKKNVALALIVSKDHRFKETRREDVPGPGAYELSPLIANTVLKGTFNATLHNPIAPVVDNDRTPTARQAFLLGV